VGDPTTQVHDFEPGIRPSGLFWTTRIGHDAVEVHDLDDARMHKTHFAMPDFHDIVNALSPSPKTTPGHVTFAVRWDADGRRRHIRDRAFGFQGEFRPAQAHIDFRVSDDGSDVVYTSDAHGQTTVGGGIGHERNGVFF
jgi:catechol 2,3-dioxygenase-like lactoylglutathione lyase family enzyme